MKLGLKHLQHDQEKNKRKSHATPSIPLRPQLSCQLQVFKVSKKEKQNKTKQDSTVDLKWRRFHSLLVHV